MSDQLKKQIQQAQTAVVDVHNQLAASVYEQKVAFDFPPYPTYATTETIDGVFKSVKDEVLYEKSIYTPKAEPEVENESGQPQQPQQKQNVFGQGQNKAEEKPLMQDMFKPKKVDHGYATDFLSQINTYSIFKYSMEKLPNKFDPYSLKEAERNLVGVLYTELDYATENMASLGYSLAAVNKMKSVVESIAVGRLSDALTVLRTAKKNFPNNRSLAFMVSQVYFYKVAQGASELLPEARSEAKKASLYAEEVNKDQLMQYRYAYVLHESNYDQARAMHLIREYYLLNPESLTESRGLGVHDGVHLKTWVLVSMMDPSHLTNYEVESIATIAKTGISGVNFYLNIIRPFVLPRLSDKDDAVVAPLKDIELMIAKSYHKYNQLVQEIQQNYNEEMDLQPASQYIWTLENRYLSQLLKAAPLPKFDEIYLYTSLDAKRHSEDVYPNKAMPAMGLPKVNYWRVWSLAITAEEGKGSNRTLPVQNIVPHAEIYRQFDRMLETLTAFEKEVIPDEKWEVIQPYMPDYEYGIFIHIAAGADAFQVPDNPYYLNFYRSWVTHKPRGPLPSQLILQMAENGHFISPHEVVAAFQGVYRVMTDEVHGLKARAKAALKACLKDSESKNAARAKDILRDGHFNEYWWLYVIVLPLAVLAFFVIFGSGGSSSGVLMLLAIVLGACVFGYVVYSFAIKGGDEEGGDDEEALELPEKPKDNEW